MQRLVECVDALKAAAASLSDQDRFHIARELNMRHGVMLGELTEANEHLGAITKRRLNSV
jgi:hypothetical protein